MSGNPEEAARRILDLAEAFKASRLLFAAQEAGVFPFLETEHNAGEVARATGWSVRGAGLMLDALAALGLLEKHGAGYRNSPAASAHLVPERPEYLGHFLDHTRRTWPRWERLPEVLRTGISAKQGRHRALSDEWRDYVLGMDEVARLNAPAVAAAAGLHGKRHLLDLGSGLGAYGRAFLEAHPELRVTFFDLRHVIAWARDRMNRPDLAPRCAWLAGDFLKDELGHGYDAIFIANVLHTLNEEENRALLRRCFHALQPGGRLLIKDFLLDPGKTGPVPSLLFSLHILLHTEGGRCYSEAEVAAWTREAGFRGGEFKSLGRVAKLWTTAK